MIDISYRLQIGDFSAKTEDVKDWSIDFQRCSHVPPFGSSVSLYDKEGVRVLDANVLEQRWEPSGSSVEIQLAVITIKDCDAKKLGISPDKTKNPWS